MIAPASADALATSTALAATSGCTGRVPGRCWIRARSMLPAIASARPSTPRVAPPSAGNGGKEP